MLTEKQRKVMNVRAKDEAIVTHIPFSDFIESEPKKKNKPCLTHWRHKPVIVGGVEHCGNCGAITGSITHLVALWKRTKN